MRRTRLISRRRRCRCRLHRHVDGWTPPRSLVVVQPCTTAVWRGWRTSLTTQSRTSTDARCAVSLYSRALPKWWPPQRLSFDVRIGLLKRKPYSYSSSSSSHTFSSGINSTLGPLSILYFCVMDLRGLISFKKI